VKAPATAKLIVALAVVTHVAAGVVVNGFPGAAPQHRASYLGISAQDPTGSPSIARDGLVAAFDMETLTGDGQLQDFSGRENHGTIRQTTPVDGLFGTARQFSTASDYIDLPENPTLAIDGPLSVAMWVRVHRLGLHQHMVACDDKFAFWLTPHDQVKFTDTVGNGVESADSVAAETWYSLVGVFTGQAGDILTRDNIALFLDGQPMDGIIFGRLRGWRRWTSRVAGYLDREVMSGTVFGRLREWARHKRWSSGVLHRQDACYIGFESHQGQPAHQKLQFEGAIDELLIFSRALTVSEVAVHARRTPNQADGQAKPHH
jgi:concanavalin A-like lectin/glucanase superfamily protein